MTTRISEKPQDLLQQCLKASSGISLESQWPITGPTATDLEECYEQLTQILQDVEKSRATYAQARAILEAEIEEAREAMKKVDSVTDGLYGPDNAKKENFGLTPKKISGRGGTPIVLDQVIIRKLSDGPDPGSISGTFETVKGASYLIEWFSDPQLTALTGSLATTSANFIARGLTRGQEYYFRVRAVKGNNAGQWSMTASRIVTQ